MKLSTALHSHWKHGSLQPVFVILFGVVVSTVLTTYDTTGETITASTANHITISITPGDQALIPDFGFLLLIGLLMFNIGALVALLFISLTENLREKV